MFASFTSILSPAIKEKLGLGPKPSVPAPASRTPKPRPVTLPGNRSMRPLPTSLHTEVQSPGFSSRLTSYLREEEALSSPGSASNSPMRSRLGVPNVSLTKKQLPRLTSKNSTKYGRGEDRVPVMMKVAPKEAYSPFKRHLSAGERSERSIRGSREEQSMASSTDPRQVIAALAELSGNKGIGHQSIILRVMLFRKEGQETI